MSSKHHHHHHSSRRDSKGTQFFRNSMAFLLFVSISLLSVSVCVKAVVLNPNEFAKIFTDKDYVNALYLDAKQYAYDVCEECSIPTDCVDEVLTFSAVYDINEAYALGSLTDSEQYNATTYVNRIDDLNSKLANATKKMLREYNIEISEGQKSSGIKSFSDKITDYVKNIIEFEYLEKLQTTVNLSKAVLIAVMAVSIILILIFTLILFASSSKKYRIFRAVAYSFIASGLLDFTAVLGVAIVRMTKELVVYPTYLCDAMMKYVVDSTNVFIMSGLASFVVAIALMTVVWKLKRDEK